MTRARRNILRGLAFVTLVVVALPLGFRVAAALRESLEPHAIAPREGAFVSVRGSDVYYQELGVASSAPSVVLIPGTMAWSGTYRDLATRLAAAGHSVVAMDLPPFGFSERPANARWDRASQAERIVAFLEARHLENVVLVGHSFGGGPTIEAAMRLGPRVRGLGLLDVAVGLRDRDAREGLGSGPLALGFVRETLVASTFTNPLGTGAAVRALVDDDTCVTDRRIAIYQRPFRARGTTPAVADWLVGGLLADERRARSMHDDAYRAFAAPTLIVWGRADTVTPLAQGEHLASLFPNAKLVVLDGVGHIPHVEDVDAVAEHLIAFLRGLPAR